MLCDKCKKIEAMIHLSEIISGDDKKLSLNLCQDCADEITEAASTKVKLEIDTMLSAPICECGSDLTSIIEDRKLGCPKCYETFEDGLQDVLWRTHSAVRHLGRMPKVDEAVVARNEVLQKLNREMKAAIGSEEYERAAEIRDELKELNGAVAERQTR